MFGLTIPVAECFQSGIPGEGDFDAGVMCGISITQHNGEVLTDGYPPPELVCPTG